MTIRAVILASAAAVAAAAPTELVISVGTQNAFFQSKPSDASNSGDIGPMNPHDYRPNEFVANDFIFEGLTAWNGADPLGMDGTAGNEDDYVSPSLATSWTTATTAAGNYEITFTLRAGVTFHDGSAWNAAAAVTNFEQIMGGAGVLGGRKVLRGMHDWLGFTQVLDAWEAVDDMTFKLIFTSYYEAALRELATIRPFRMSSVAVLPSIANYELSHTAARNGALRNPWPPRCDNFVAGSECFMFRGVAAPVGTGPYKVVDKLLSDGSRLAAANFNATCYTTDACVYSSGVYVKEVLFTKHTGHYKNPTYDNVILRAYDSQAAVAAALSAGTLDIAYGVNTLSPSSFISLATAESGAGLVAHQAGTDLNIRNLVINSGTIINKDLRKLIVGAVAPGRQALYDGELSEETPMNTLFDPTQPHCSVLSSLDTPEVVAATRSPDVSAANFTKPLRLLYRAYEPHSVMIAAEVQARLFAAGINVQPMAVQTRDAYNSFNCDYLSGFSYGGTAYGDDVAGSGEGCTNDDPECLAKWHSWDLSLSQTWGPPYDPTSKLWDMTHMWCSGESDAPAVVNMESMSFSTFRTNVRALSTTADKTAREALYATVLTALHNEAVFLPITAKRQTAVTNVRVSGFQFGYMEFDLPLANLFPTPPSKDADDLSTTALAGIAAAAAVALLFFLCLVCLICKERQGKPVFSSISDPAKTSASKTSAAA